ncbi:MAG: synthase, subunit b [Clostridiales bacterium]|jgi:F-type H+-transporting ATPase subunit b|nr:synthase, subunit b [Clostridiales bacterium]
MKEIINLDIPTFIWVIVNLLVLYFILKKVLFKPVTDFMDKRTNSISEAIDNADKSKAEAADLKQKYEDQLKGTKVEGDKIINAARARANNEYEEILNSAKKDAEELLIKAREELERERANMLREVRNQVATLALSAASKVIEANMDNDRNKEIVERFMDEAGAA